MDNGKTRKLKILNDLANGSRESLSDAILYSNIIVNQNENKL